MLKKLLILVDKPNKIYSRAVTIVGEIFLNYLSGKPITIKTSGPDEAPQQGHRYCQNTITLIQTQLNFTNV